MAIEAERGCGYRKVGGLYLCGEGPSMACDRLPYPLEVCPVCGGGVKFSRGFRWLDWFSYAGYHFVNDLECHCKPGGGQLCPVCFPKEQNMPYGLLWVGEAFYSPEAFLKEGLEMGVSKRIAAISKNLKLGETWILFAHKKALSRTSDDPHPGTFEDVPGIFYAFRPQRLELLIWESEATMQYLAELRKKGITPVIIPDGDIDHDPATKLKMTADERTAAADAKSFRAMRDVLGEIKSMGE